MKTKTWRDLCSLFFALLFALMLAALLGLSAPQRSFAADAAPAKQVYKDTAWETLVPKGWDPFKRLGDPSMVALSDADPRIMDMMREMREAFDNAPTIAALDGSAVRMPGYVVPLEQGKDGLREFLLVPYFGACIHSPPPPANQIVHVRMLDKPAKGLRSMDPVWVSGVLRSERQQTDMGVSGYRLEAVLVQPYANPARR